MIIDRTVHQLPVTRLRTAPRVPRHRAVRRADMAGLGFSLKPPKVVRNLVSSLFKNTDAKVSVPTPVGPVSVDLKNPADLQRVKDAVTGAKLQITTGTGARVPAGSPLQVLDDQVQKSVPGGWGTVAVAGLAVLGLLMFAGRARAGRAG